ncbi:DegT/DnrJ/EryC1/StrS family aminotransferase [Candidatus Woesearchaeota archaeon]|nr:DegT/DnrJ/EryC1/StrS family aminotransferase [Candidatus Woesearchaeota archaeon]MBW3006504.1 DegT/DnrJ/EryC1/StrS family aminotransferase [Candidatus Woesearchaeota archaeon]
MKIKVAIPIVDEEEVQAVREVLLSGHYTSGPKVKEFEEKFADYIGVKYAVAVNSGTAALHLGLATLGIKSGDEVIVPAMTFFATASAVVHQGGTPVFCDIDNNYCMDPADLKKRITERTKAIIPVHLYGYAANMEEILKIAKEHNLKVIEDCAQGIGTEIDGKKVGQFGDCGAFSFFATKNMTTGEGGIITTDNEEIANMAKILRSHGMTNRNDHEYIGYNYRMSEINAAIGLTQLKKLPEMNKKRIENSKYLLNNIKDIDWLVLEKEPQNVTHSYFWCPLQIDESKLGMTTLQLRQLLFEKGVETRHRYIEPLYKQNALKNNQNIDYKQISLKNAEAFSGKLLGLPNHPKLTKEELDYIIKILHEVGK